MSVDSTALRRLRSAAAATGLASLVVCPLLLDPAAVIEPAGGAGGIDGTLEVKSAGLVIAACVAGALALAAAAWSGRVGRPIGGIEGAILAFVGLGAASAAWAGQRGAVVESVVALGAAATIGVLLGRLARRADAAGSIAAWAAGGALAAGGLDAVARRLGVGAGTFVEGAAKFETLWFPHTNVAALLLTPVGAGALAYACVSPAGGRRRWAVVVGSAAALLVLDLGSRAGLAALVAGPVLLLGAHRLSAHRSGDSGSPARRWSLGLLGVVLLGAVVLIPRQPAASSFLKEAFNRAVAWTGVNYHAAYMRPGLWKSTFAVADERPGLGVGLGNLFFELPRVDSIEPYRPHAHNQYLQVFAELGGLGLLAFLGLLVFGGAGALRAVASPDRERRAIGAAFGGGLAALALHATLETPLEFPFTALLFFVLVAVAVALGRGPDPSWRILGRPGRAAAAGMAIALLMAAGPTALAPLRQLELLRGGEQARAAGDLDRAVQAYARAAGVGRDHYALHVPWATVEMRRERFAEAARAWERAVSRFPNAWRLHEQHGLCLGRLGRVDEALAALERARSLQPAAGELLLWRGRVLLDAGRLDEAVDALGQQAAARPDDTASLLTLANAYYERSVRDDALEDAEAALVRYRRYLSSGGVQPSSWVSKRIAQLGHWLRLEEIGADAEETPTNDEKTEKDADGNAIQDGG